MKKQDSTIEHFLKLADVLEKAPAGLHFAHSFVRAKFVLVSEYVKKALVEDLPNFPRIFSGCLDSYEDRKLFLAEASDGTILWHRQSDLPVMQAISERLSADVNWISVSEELRCWAYARFAHGECDVLVRDPERYWESNVLQGEDLVGGGQRQFPTLNDFLKRIRNSYVPVDTAWAHIFWADPNTRKDIIESGVTTIQKCICMTAKGTSTIIGLR